MEAKWLSPDEARLKKKHLELLKWAAQGLTNKEIAEKVSYALKTIEALLSLSDYRSIYAKIGVQNKAEAAAWYQYWFGAQSQSEAESELLSLGALEFELYLNCAWLDNVFETSNYLRDEAWVNLQKSGYALRLPSSISTSAITAYDRIYALNRHLKILKEEHKRFDFNMANEIRNDLKKGLARLVHLFDEANIVPRTTRKAMQRGMDVRYIAAIRFELQSNLMWLDNIFETMNYLRDEAWVGLKNSGQTLYLPASITSKLITVYDKTHGLNGKIKLLKERDERFELTKAEEERGELRDEISQLILLLDDQYSLELGHLSKG